jgi:DNA (cytosine-5)-methyltransferase 1
MPLVHPQWKMADLFCCRGGATRGYQLAGFNVTGVDIEPQPLYCGDEFIQSDALTFDLTGFDAVHASPPCQAFTAVSNRWRGNGGKSDQHPSLIAPVRDLLVESGLPYVIENVVGARSELRSPVLFNGDMFGLGTFRPRLFESNVLIMAPGRPPKGVQGVGVYGKSPDGRRLSDTTGQRAASSVEEGREAMGMPWADWHGLTQAIPPAYTEHIGKQLVGHLEASAVS